MSRWRPGQGRSLLAGQFGGEGALAGGNNLVNVTITGILKLFGHAVGNPPHLQFFAPKEKPGWSVSEGMRYSSIGGVDTHQTILQNNFVSGAINNKAWLQLLASDNAGGSSQFEVQVNSGTNGVDSLSLLTDAGNGALRLSGGGAWGLGATIIADVLKGAHLRRIPNGSIGYAIDHTMTANPQTTTTGDLRGTLGIGAAARGVIGMLVYWTGTAAPGDYCRIYSADEPSNTFQPTVFCQVAGVYNEITVAVALGTGANAGQLTIYQNSPGAIMRNVFWATHYWE